MRKLIILIFTLISFTLIGQEIKNFPEAHQHNEPPVVNDTTATLANLAGRTTGLWEGATSYVQDEDREYLYTGSEWILKPGTFADVSSDSSNYVRSKINGTTQWSKISQTDQEQKADGLQKHITRWKDAVSRTVKNNDENCIMLLRGDSYTKTVLSQVKENIHSQLGWNGGYNMFVKPDYTDNIYSQYTNWSKYLMWNNEFNFHRRSTYSSIVGATIKLSERRFNKFTIHYLDTIGGGTFSVRLGHDGTKTNISTSGTEAVKWREFNYVTARELNYDTVYIELESGHVQLFGYMFIYDLESGAVVHAVYDGASSPDDLYDGRDTASVRVAMDTLNHIIDVQVWFEEQNQNTLYNELDSMLNLYRFFRPHTDFLFITPHSDQKLGEEAKYLKYNNEAVYFTLQNNQDVGIYNLYEKLADAVVLDSLGVMEDSVHLVNSGYYLPAYDLSKELLPLGVDYFEFESDLYTINDDIGLAKVNSTNYFVNGAGNMTTTGARNVGVGGLSLTSNTSGLNNTALGYSVLNANTTGTNNTAMGYVALSVNTSGIYNTAVGSLALQLNEEGNNNTAIGRLSLSANTTGSSNTAVGASTLAVNTTGSDNTAIGYLSLSDNTGGGSNVSVGYGSMGNNTEGSYNTSMGYLSLNDNLTGNYNTSYGYLTLEINTTGINNTAIGRAAMQDNLSGNFNTAVGAFSLGSNISGASNASFGRASLNDNTMGSFNSAFGVYALANITDGVNNIGIGYEAGLLNVNGDGNVFLGYKAGYNETGSDKLYIDNSNTTTPLIYGDFANDSTVINGKLNVTGDALVQDELQLDSAIYIDRTQEEYLSLYKFNLYDGFKLYNFCAASGFTPMIGGWNHYLSRVPELEIGTKTDFSSIYGSRNILYGDYVQWTQIQGYWNAQGTSLDTIRLEDVNIFGTYNLRNQRNGWEDGAALYSDLNIFGRANGMALLGGTNNVSLFGNGLLDVFDTAYHHYAADAIKDLTAIGNRKAGDETRTLDLEGTLIISNADSASYTKFNTDYLLSPPIQGYTPTIIPPLTLVSDLSGGALDSLDLSGSVVAGDSLWFSDGSNIFGTRIVSYTNTFPPPTPPNHVVEISPAIPSLLYSIVYTTRTTFLDVQTDLYSTKIRTYEPLEWYEGGTVLIRHGDEPLLQHIGSYLNVGNNDFIKPGAHSNYDVVLGTTIGYGVSSTQGRNVLVGNDMLAPSTATDIKMDSNVIVGQHLFQVMPDAIVRSNVVVANESIDNVSLFKNNVWMGSELYFDPAGPTREFDGTFMIGSNPDDQVSFIDSTNALMWGKFNPGNLDNQTLKVNGLLEANTFYSSRNPILPVIDVYGKSTFRGGTDVITITGYSSPIDALTITSSPTGNITTILQSNDLFINSGNDFVIGAVTSLSLSAPIVNISGSLNLDSDLTVEANVRADSIKPLQDSSNVVLDSAKIINIVNEIQTSDNQTITGERNFIGDVYFNGAKYEGTTTVSTATYTLAESDYSLEVTYSATGVCTITLPSAQTTRGRVIEIIDTGWEVGSAGASTNNIQIVTEGAELISGDPIGVTINNDYGGLQLRANGTNWIIKYILP